MSKKEIDLGEYVKSILDQKNIDTILNLQPACRIKISDPDKLNELIVYLLNYFNSLTHHPLNIAVDDEKDGIMLSFIIATDLDSIPAFDIQLDRILRVIRAQKRLVFEKSKYVQLLVTFKSS